MKNIFEIRGYGDFLRRVLTHLKTEVNFMDPEAYHTGLWVFRPKSKEACID